MGGLSGQCRETAPAAAELCCIWAGRAWGGTCAGPLHVVVAVPGLTGNVHGLKVRYVTFQRWKWCGCVQKCDFSPVPVLIAADFLLIWKLVTSFMQPVRMHVLFDYSIGQMLLFLCAGLI